MVQTSLSFIFTNPAEDEKKIKTTPHRVPCVWSSQVDFQHPDRGDDSSSGNGSPEASEKTLQV